MKTTLTVQETSKPSSCIFPRITRAVEGGDEKPMIGGKQK